MINLDNRKILFGILIIITIFTCLTSVYCSNPQSDNIVKVGNIEFNTTADSHITKFELYNRTDYDDGSYYEQYVDENFIGYNIFIWNISASNEWDNFTNFVEKQHIDDPSETINGIMVYNTTAGQGENAGEQRFDAFIVNNNYKTIVEFSTPTPDETVKLASSLKFL